MSETGKHQRLIDVAPELASVLTRGKDSLLLFAVPEIECQTLWMTMRDGVRLATDIYLPPRRPAPVIAMRTPYGRAHDKLVGAFMSFARRGYAVVSQDCRGTGDSEPDRWDYYIYESEDGLDFVEWVSRQDWCDGFLGSCGGSYVGQTQWCMAMHPRMSTIVPEVSGLGVAINTAHIYMGLSAYARSVGKGQGQAPVSHGELERQIVDETLAGGYFNEPIHQPFSPVLLERYPTLRTLSPEKAKQWLWERYCELSCAERGALVKVVLGTDRVTAVNLEYLSSIFGHRIAHDAHTVPHASQPELCLGIQAPVLLHTGWYDWGLNDALATWHLFRREARVPIAARSRLIIAPSAHNALGYIEGIERHPELQHNHRTTTHVELLLRWYAAVREGTTDAWPTVIYYLMGANEWRVADDWPPPEMTPIALYLGGTSTLSTQAPSDLSEPDQYTFDPRDPTPTVGGSIVSQVYPPGSVDVSEVQQRADVLTYTTPVLKQDLDVVGPLQLVLYASSSAVDTDFCARLSDVFPDGRALQLQSAILRARYRNLTGEPELLEPGRIYEFTIDLWATANRFKAGHRLRLDIASADFPHFDRNSNRGGEPGEPLVAQQTIYRDAERPSRLIVYAPDSQRRALSWDV